ncbi:MAG: hypothetical protein LBB09_01265 [Rickettsiales bacterium]|jgi:TolB protein|nr:hypothetical protein [Rickettsiales bacterium]
MFRKFFIVWGVLLCLSAEAGDLSGGIDDLIAGYAEEEKEEKKEKEEKWEELAEEEKSDVEIFFPCFAIDNGDNGVAEGDGGDAEAGGERNADDYGLTRVDDIFLEDSGGNKIIYENINRETFGAYFSDKKMPYGKMSKTLEDIFAKIIGNFKYLGAYGAEYRKDFCDDATKFIRNGGGGTEIRDYVMSNNFKRRTRLVSNSELKIIDQNTFELKLFVWDVKNLGLLESKRFAYNIKNSPTDILADVISDLIFSNLEKGERGIFDSKMAYISETGAPKNRTKQIVLANFTGNEKIKITRGKNTKLTPIFSKQNPEEIFYNEELENGFFVVKHNIVDGNRQIITKSDLIMTTSPVFHPKENKILVSGTDGDGNTNLYLFDLENNTDRKITNTEAICTAASFNPAGNKIVYTSDKSGVKKLYVRDLENNREYMLTKEHGNYDKPAWSPDGKTIAFIKIEKNDFSLGLIDANGENERYLLKNFLIEGVKWTPSSRFLTYTKQTDVFGKMSIPKIYLLDLKTMNERQIPVAPKEGASDIDIILN